MRQGNGLRLQGVVAVHDRASGSAALLAGWRFILAALWGVSPAAFVHHGGYCAAAGNGGVNSMPPRHSGIIALSAFGLRKP